MAIDPAALARTIASLEHLDPVESGLQHVLEQVISSTKILFQVDGAGLMLLAEDEVLRYAAASDAHGRQLETIQEQVGEGPCVESFTTGTVVSCEDVGAERRWPAYVQLAGERGFGAVLGVPVELRGGPVGTLNVYSSTPHTWDEGEILAIRAYTVLLSTLLRAAAGAHLAEATAAQLQYALDHRVLVEQAKGIIMEREGLDAHDAYERLRTSARSRRVKVVEVARSIVDKQPAR